MFDNLTQDQLEAIRKYAESLRAEKSEGEKNMEAIMEKMGDIAEKLGDLKPKEKTKAEKQMEKLIAGNDPLKEAAMEKYLAMDTRSQAAWRHENKEAYDKLFPEETVSIPKPANYSAIKEKIMNDPSKLHTVPMNVWTYANVADKSFYEFMEGAGEVIRAEQSAKAANPTKKAYDKMMGELEGSGNE